MCVVNNDKHNLIWFGRIRSGVDNGELSYEIDYEKLNQLGRLELKYHMIQEIQLHW